MQHGFKDMSAGRKKIFNTPEELWDWFEDYKFDIDENPHHKLELIKSGDLAGQIVPIPTQRPYTWAGFESYLFDQGIAASLNDYRYNRKGAYELFSVIIEKIGRAMYAQKFEGAATGMFKENLIARELGLAEKQQEVKPDIDSHVDMSKLSPESLEDIAKHSKHATERE